MDHKTKKLYRPITLYGNERATLHRENNHEGGRLLLLIKDGLYGKMTTQSAYGYIEHRQKTRTSFVVQEYVIDEGFYYFTTDTGEKFKVKSGR